MPKTASAPTATNAKKNGTVIMACTCAHTFQDKAYGNGKRLHNIAGGGSKARCTVCAGLKDNK